MAVKGDQLVLLDFGTSVYHVNGSGGEALCGYGKFSREPAVLFEDEVFGDICKPCLRRLQTTDGESDG